MILILLMATAVSCSNIHPMMMQQPVGGMPAGMEFCDQGRLKKLCRKGVLKPSTPQRPVALGYCPGTLKKLCPIKPVALQFSSEPVSSIPVGWKICRDNLGLCPIRPSMTRPTLSLDSRFGPPRKIPISFVGPYSVTHNKGMVPCKDRMGMCSPSDTPSMASRPMTHNKGMVPCKYKMGMCPPGSEEDHDNDSDDAIASRPITFNKGMVPCKYKMGMCPPGSEEDHGNDSDDDIASRPIIFNKGMVPCKYKMGMCPPGSEEEDNNGNDDTTASQPMTYNKGMVPCKYKMGMCPPGSEENNDNDRKMPITVIGPYKVSHNKGMVPCKDRMGMCHPEN